MSSLKDWTLPLLSLALLALTFSVFGLKGVSKSVGRVSAPAAGQLPISSQGAVKLSFSASQFVLKNGQVQKVEVGIDSGREKINSVEVHVSYDPKSVSVKNLKEGTFLPNALVIKKEADDAKGELMVVLGTLKPREGKGNLFSFEIAGKKKGTSNLTISEKTLVAASGKSQNVLGSTVGSSVKVE